MVELLFPRTILVDGEPVPDSAYVDLPTTKRVDGRDVLLTGDEQVAVMGGVAWKDCVNGQDVQLSKVRQQELHATWATNLLASEKRLLVDEAKERLRATDAERADLVAAATLDPGQRPALQALEDYLAALKALPATIETELDKIGVLPWPEKPVYVPEKPVYVPEKPVYVPEWPAKP